MTRDDMAPLLVAYRDGEIAEADAGRVAEIIRERGDASKQWLAEIEHEGLIAQALDDTDADAFLRGFWERHRAEQDGEREHFVHDFEEKRAGESTSRPRPRRAWLALAATVSVVALLAAGGTFWMRAGVRPIARLENVRGEVFVTRDHADQRATPGTPLLSGDGVRVMDEESSAAIVFADGTRLELGEDTLVTRVTEDDDAGKRVVLADGFFTAQVAKQPAGRPMILKTPNSEVVVLGTTFSLSVGTAVTHLETQSGNVRLKRTGDGTSVEVPAGFDAIVAAVGDPLVAQPLAPRAGDARQELEGSWIGSLSPDTETLVATRYIKGDVEIWDTATKQKRSAFRAHDKRATAAAYSRDGRTLITGSLDGTVKLWDAATGGLRATLSPAVGEITSLMPSRDGRSLIVLSYDAVGGSRILSAWDFETQSLRWGPKRFSADRVALSPDGAMLAASRKQDRHITVWNLATGEEKTVLRAGGDAGSGLLRNVFSMAFSHDGRTLAVDDASGLVSLWDIASSAVKSRFQRHGGRIFGMGFSPDDRLLATGQQDDTIRIWDLASATPVAAFAGHRLTQVRDVAFASDGRTLLTRGIRVATADRARDGILQLWDVPASITPTKTR